MRMDINSIVKSARVLAKNAAKGIAKNKHAIIECGLGGLLAYVGIDSNSNGTWQRAHEVQWTSILRGPER